MKMRSKTKKKCDSSTENVPTKEEKKPPRSPFFGRSEKKSARVTSVADTGLRSVNSGDSGSSNSSSYTDGSCGTERDEASGCSAPKQREFDRKLRSKHAAACQHMKVSDES